MMADRQLKREWINGKETPESYLWKSMINRCYLPSDTNYSRYGAKGVTVCDRWRYSLANFIQDMGRRPSPEMTLERINNRKGYEPRNVRWATRLEQGRNTSRNTVLTIDGQTHCISEWAEISGISASTISSRLNRKVPLDRLLESPVATGTIARQTKTHRLSPAIKKRIIQRLKKGEKNRDIAVCYGVGESMVSKIRVEIGLAKWRR